jgi:hypothetical protein
MTVVLRVAGMDVCKRYNRCRGGIPSMNNQRFSRTSLPVRPEYVTAVRAALKRHSSLNRKRLLEASGLSLTQALCAIYALIALGEVEYEQQLAVFRLPHRGAGG